MARVRQEPIQSAVTAEAIERRQHTAQDNADDSDRPRTVRRQRTRRVISDESSAEDSEASRDTAIKVTKSQPESRIRLAPLQSLSSASSLTIRDDRKEKRSRTRQRPNHVAETKRVSVEGLSYPTHQPVPSAPEVDDGAEETDVEESIWCGSVEESQSSSDDELPSPRKWFNSRPRELSAPKPPVARPLASLSKQFEALSMFDDEQKAVPRQKTMCNNAKYFFDTSDKEKDHATIKQLSPPRLCSTSKHDPIDRPSTPPPPPASPSKLKSPSKRIGAPIPAQPFHPSLDAFWTADAVNDWNDQYSPQKPLKSPRKLKFQPNDEPTSPTTSPGKRNSPTKRTKAQLDIRKDFEARKHALAESFLSELDRTVTAGKIAELSASTGGVQLLWSKTLNSTAGRANWRRESTKIKSRDGTITTSHKHHASIELASKVIDDEDRLLNVIAHEFCHLANFMVSGIKDQPHGASFKQWGRKCTTAFGSRGVEVTTKHTYEIEYKYIWQCVDVECGTEFKRHSKSIDSARHRCGRCKKELVQIKPMPRKGAAGKGSSGAGTSTLATGGKAAGAPPVTGYAAFVKEHFASLKKSMPGAAHKEVMQALGEKYRVEKAAKEGKTNFGSLANAIAKDLEAVKLGAVVKEKEIIHID